MTITLRAPRTDWHDDRDGALLEILAAQTALWMANEHQRVAVAAAQGHIIAAMELLGRLPRVAGDSVWLARQDLQAAQRWLDAEAPAPMVWPSKPDVVPVALADDRMHRAYHFLFLAVWRLVTNSGGTHGQATVVRE